MSKQQKQQKQTQTQTGVETKTETVSDIKPIDGKTAKGGKHGKNGKSGKTSHKPISPKVPKIKQDPSDYVIDDRMLKDIASIPFLDVIGSSYRLGGPNNARIDMAVIPGVIVYPYMPVIGTQDNSNSSINRLMIEYFNSVSSGFSAGTVPFQASDLMMTAIAGAQVFDLINEIKRAYSVGFKFALQNKYLAKGLVEACGIDYDDLDDNWSAYRTRLNRLIRTANEIVFVPKDLKILNRWLKLSSNIFCDGPDAAQPQKQFFMAKPICHLQWSGIATPTQGTSLIMTYHGYSAGGVNNTKLGTWLNELEGMITALTGDDAREIFSAIKQRVYGDSAGVQASLLDEVPEFTFGYDDRWLEQFHNLNPVAGIPGTSSGGFSLKYFTWDNQSDTATYSDFLLPSSPATVLNKSPVIFQENGYIKSIFALNLNLNDLKARDRYIRYSDYELLDLLTNNNDPATVIDATSAINTCEGLWFKVDAANERSHIHTRSELWFSPEVWKVGRGDGVFYVEPVTQIKYLDNANILDWAYSGISTFNYPMLSHWIHESGTNQHTATPIGELVHYTRVGKETIANMHDNVMYAMLQLPVVKGTFSK